MLNGSQAGYTNECGSEENLSHWFFECPKNLTIWYKILLWLNQPSALHNFVLANFSQFAGLIRSNRKKIRLFKRHLVCEQLGVMEKSQYKDFKNKSGYRKIGPKKSKSHCGIGLEAK